MNWRGYSPTKKGVWVGFILTLLAYVVAFAFFAKFLVIDGWSGIVQTAGGATGNVVAWVLIYGFLAAMLSLLAAVPIGLVLVSISALIGLLYGKVRGSSPQTTPINTSYLPK